MLIYRLNLGLMVPPQILELFLADLLALALLVLYIFLADLLALALLGLFLFLVYPLALALLVLYLFLVYLLALGLLDSRLRNILRNQCFLNFFSKYFSIVLMGILGYHTSEPIH